MRILYICRVKNCHAMKKIVRVVWISVLTGLAFLVACTSQHKLSKQEAKRIEQEKKELRERRSQIVERLNQFQTSEYYQWETDLFNLNSDMDIGVRLRDLDSLSKDNQEEIELLKQLQQIDEMLNDTLAMEKNQQDLSSAMRKQKFIREAIENAIPPCVYGPPEMMGGNRFLKDPEEDQPEQEPEQDPQELEEQERREQQMNEEKQARKDQQRKTDSIRNARDRERQVCVYGPPPSERRERDRISELNRRINQVSMDLNNLTIDIQLREDARNEVSPEEIEAYDQETNRLKEQVQDMIKELNALKHERKARGL